MSSVKNQARRYCCFYVVNTAGEQTNLDTSKKKKWNLFTCFVVVWNCVDCNDCLNYNTN